MKEPIFKATHIVKQFGPTIALNDVDIEIFKGEIRGFIGENGSGKSTMSAIMTGIYEPTSGTMEYHGKEWKPSSMIEALNGGIGIIVQENGTIAQISVAENIYLGELDQFSGVNYFEERKIENFSPLFKLDLSDFDKEIDNAKEKLLATTDKKEINSVIDEVKRGRIKAIFESLQAKEKEEVSIALAKEDEDFDSSAKKAFDEFNVNNEKIKEKYLKNEENLDELTKSRRLQNELNAKETKDEIDELLQQI